MTDPSLALQAAIVAALKADPDVTDAVVGRIYDQPSPGVAFPYITLGEDQVIPDRADCYDGSEVTLTLHVWSRERGFPEAKRIVAAMRAALHEAPLTLEDDRLIEIAFSGARYLRDPDGVTSHAVVTFTALTEPV